MGGIGNKLATKYGEKIISQGYKLYEQIYQSHIFIQPVFSEQLVYARYWNLEIKNE